MLSIRGPRCCGEAEDESRSLHTPVPAIPVLFAARLWHHGFGASCSVRGKLGCLWRCGSKGGCWHPCLAEARGAGPLLPAHEQRGSIFCSPSLLWAAKRFLSTVKKHLPALLETWRSGQACGLHPEPSHLPEHQPPQTASVRSLLE